MRAALAELSLRERRFLAFGLAAVALTLAWKGGVAPYLETGSELRREIRLREDLLVRERALVAAGDAHRAAADAAADRLLAMAPSLFDGSKPGVAASALAEHVQAAARASRVHLVRLDPVPAGEPEDGVAALALRVEGESDLEGLLGLLAGLESSPKLVRVDGLGVRAVRPSGSGRTDEEEVLSFDFRVTGYMLREPPAEGSEEDPAVAGAPPTGGSRS